ncbi:hypothetical protein KSP40_PGU008652 [Platanthera guangdongensis]|uniref:Uncharacterized protein n=1 Tax=Platanthera guangdongensis TaxID=2320717 RepID=A0ABR2LEW9_9ASPA
MYYNSQISRALVVRALLENQGLIDWRLIFKASYGLIALICGNGYIVGINQIYDIGIDKVNKPYLPIAAGDLSVKSAWLLVLFFAVTGILIVAYNFGPFICSLYCLGLLLGTIYSVPPFRLKRYPVAAFLIIATTMVLLRANGDWRVWSIGFDCASLSVINVEIDADVTVGKQCRVQDGMEIKRWRWEQLERDELLLWGSIRTCEKRIVQAVRPLVEQTDMKSKELFETENCLTLLCLEMEIRD